MLRTDHHEQDKPKRGVPKTKASVDREGGRLGDQREMV